MGHTQAASNQAATSPGISQNRRNSTATVPPFFVPRMSQNTGFCCRLVIGNPSEIPGAAELQCFEPGKSYSLAENEAGFCIFKI